MLGSAPSWVSADQRFEIGRLCRKNGRLCDDWSRNDGASRAGRKAGNAIAATEPAGAPAHCGGGLLSLVTWRLRSVVVLAVLVLVLMVGFFALLTLASDAIALGRGHSWRWWWRTSPDEGSFWLGTCIPRRLRRPR